MGKFLTRKNLFSAFVALVLVLGGFAGGAMALSLSGPQAHASGLPYANYAAFVKYIQSHHKAPFDHDLAFSLGKSGAQGLVNKDKQGVHVGQSGSGTNVKVNQDRNPWPKAEVGAAVDPVTGKNYVVMENDFRENFDHQFFHVSTNGGATWTDDSMAVGIDFNTGAPFNFQSDPGVAFDSVGHSFISNISGNQFFDFSTVYENFDTGIVVATGYGNGTYNSLLPSVIDFQPCSGDATSFSCDAQLDKPLITVDNVAGSPHKGRIYVYYTLFCNGGPGNTPCVDGNAEIPAFTSAILESHADGADLPFSVPSLVSGSLQQEQFSSMVIDSHGVPHIFFDDFSRPYPSLSMYMSTLTGSGWVVNSTPVANFQYTGMNNINWGFRDLGNVAPGCGISKDTAYCAFASTRIGAGPISATPNMDLVRVNTQTGVSHITRVNNDPFGNTKHHFFGWASAAPNGSVYVGWYDDRNDPFNTKVQYFVGKSTDGGASFPVQKAVSDTSFNPCVGFPGCGFFGDYTQIVTGPDGVTHAAWSDTRDGASMQIYTQAITW